MHCIAFPCIVLTFPTWNVDKTIVPAVGFANMRIPLHVAQQLRQWLQSQRLQ